METRIQWKSDAFKFDVKQHLNDFAVEGLWTLVMGRRILTSQEFDTLFWKITELEISNDPLWDAKLFDLYNEIEDHLEFLGASAIEDKL